MNMRAYQRGLCALSIMMMLPGWSSAQDGVWGPARPLGSAVNNGSWALTPCVSSDGQIMIFQADSSSRPGGQGRRDLWMAILQEGGEYGSVENLSQVNSGAMEQQPSLSADKSSLYFSSTRGASQDIFVARWTGETYAEPELVSGLVNTAASEAFPVISADGNELFFQREGAMHLATRSDADDPEAPFDEIVALGALDLASFEWPSSLSADGRVLFFAHTDGSTFSQIYTATREEPGAPFELPPVLVSGTTAGGVHPFISFDWPSAFPLTGPPRVRSSGS